MMKNLRYLGTEMQVPEHENQNWSTISLLQSLAKEIAYFSTHLLGGYYASMPS